jgi:hypothetical protein
VSTAKQRAADEMFSFYGNKEIQNVNATIKNQ